MKLLFTIVLISFFAMCSAAHADWAEDFIAAVAQRGTDAAVQEAFEDGVSPADIMAIVEQTGAVQIEPESVIKALYCSGVSGPVVHCWTLC